MSTQANQLYLPFTEELHLARSGVIVQAVEELSAATGTEVRGQSLLVQR